MINRAPHSLYLHVPFCVSKCPYCDFNSHVGLEGLFESYSRALVTEIESLDAACARGDRPVERARSGVREHLVAVLLPHPIQRLEARR